MPSELSSSILDQADRPTSLLIVACGRASRDTSDRSYYAASLRNIVAFLIDNFDAETQKSVLQVGYFSVYVTFCRDGGEKERWRRKEK